MKKTLEEIKEEVAKDSGYTDEASFPSAWNHLLNAVEDDGEFDSHFNEVAKRYTEQCCEDLRKRIAKEAKLKPYTYPDGYKSNVISVIDKDSIRNVEIILP